MTLTDKDLTLARKVAYRVGSKWSLVEIDDLTSELTLWMVEHADTVARYRDEEHGEAKLFVALRRLATKYSVREQTVRSGGPLMDDDPYTVEQVERALPYLFEETPQTTVHEHPGARWDGSHGLALTIMTDMRGAFADLPPQVQETLTLRFRDGLSFADMATLTGITKRAAKHRVDRAVRRLRDHLSGRTEQGFDVRS